MSRPNVLFFLSDDHARGAVGLYADRLKGIVETPNIDRIGRDGVAFMECAAENSICSPGRAAAYSGQHTRRHGVFMLGKGMEEPKASWPRVLDDAGYDTAVIGKWHLENPPDEVFPGFSAVVKGQGEWFDPQFEVRRRGQAEETQSHPGGYTSDAYTDIALDWLKTKRDPSKPFALSMNYKNMHHSFEYPDRYLDYKSDLRDFADPASLMDKVLGCGAAACHSRSFITPHLHDHVYLGTNAYERYFDFRGDKRTRPVPKDDGETPLETRYETYMLKMIRCVKGMDDNVGRLLQYLEGARLLENTVVVYTTDQGYFLGEHGLHGKRTVLDATMMMPLIFMQPGSIRAGHRSDHMVQNVDIGPTLLDMCLGSVSPRMQGRSMKGICTGEDDSWHTDSQLFGYFQTEPYQIGLRTRRYTYCRVGRQNNYKIDFYDRQEDPDQRTNAHADPKYKAVIEQLSDQLDAKLEELGYTSDFLPGGSAWAR